MMIKVQHGQSLMDVAVQFYGTAEALVELATDNGLALDGCVFAGNELFIRDELPETGEALYVNYIRENNIVVVSGQGCDGELIELLSTNDDEVFTDNEDNGIEV